MASVSLRVALAAAAAAVLAPISGSAQTQPFLAGLQPVNNITVLSRLDLDVASILAAIAPNTNTGYQSGYSIYSNGQNAMPNKLQNLIGPITSDFSSSFLFTTYSSYWASQTYADDFTNAALQGTGMFQNVPAPFRYEGVEEGIILQVVWGKVIWLMETALSKCEAGDSANALLAWEQAWALYSGSLEGGTGAGTGTMLYNVAEERCQEFGTCTSGTRAYVNARVLSIISAGRPLIAENVCEELEKEVDEYVEIATLPLLQGVLKAFYLADPSSGSLLSADDRVQEWAEGWGYLAAVLPRIAKCDSSVAAKLRANLDVAAAAPMKDGHVAARKALESVYSCLHAECDEVGAFTAIPNNKPCSDADVSTETLSPIAGFVPNTDVTGPSRIDLDITDLEAFLDEADWASAISLYSKGKNAQKTPTSLWSLQGFSTEHATDTESFDLYDLYAGYWKNLTYADNFVMSALQGTGDFAGKSNVIRGYTVEMTVEAMHSWMKIFDELHENYENCENGVISKNPEGVYSWDEAWAVYAGSLVGTDGSTSGELTWSLAQKFCVAFGTCGDNGFAIANLRVRAEFERGRGLYLNGLCDQSNSVALGMIPLMTVPLVQGALLYTYFSDPKGGYKGSTTNYEKEQAFAWVFLASILPQINKCDKDTATYLTNQLKISSSSRLSDGNVAVRKAFQKVYKCLGISCSDIGAIAELKETVCQDSTIQSTAPPSSNTLSGGAIAAIVIVVLVVYFASIWCCYRSGVKKGRASAQEGMKADPMFNKDAEANNENRLAQL